MPTQRALARARKDRREGKSASTQAGEFVREEMKRLRAGESGSRTPAQAIAIGLAEARRAGIKLPAKKKAGGVAKRRSDASVAKESPAAPAKRKATAKKSTRARAATSSRAAGATRAARTRAMRARTR